MKNLRDKRVEVRLEAARSVDLIPILKEEKSSVFRRNTIEALGLAGLGARRTIHYSKCTRLPMTNKDTGSLLSWGTWVREM